MLVAGDRQGEAGEGNWEEPSWELGGFNVTVIKGSGHLMQGR